MKKILLFLLFCYINLYSQVLTTISYDTLRVRGWLKFGTNPGSLSSPVYDLNIGRYKAKTLEVRDTVRLRGIHFTDNGTNVLILKSAADSVLTVKNDTIAYLSDIVRLPDTVTHYGEYLKLDLSGVLVWDSVDVDTSMVVTKANTQVITGNKYYTAIQYFRNHIQVLEAIELTGTSNIIRGKSVGLELRSGDGTTSYDFDVGYGTGNGEDFNIWGGNTTLDFKIYQGGDAYLADSLYIGGSVKALNYFAGDNTLGASTTTGGLIFKNGLYTSGTLTSGGLPDTTGHYNYYLHIGLAGEVEWADLDGKANVSGWTANKVLTTDAFGFLNVSSYNYSDVALLSGTVNATEFGYLNGVTSNIQDQIDSKANMAGWTTSRVAITDAFGILNVSSVTPTTLGYLDATSSVQTQLNNKATLTGATFSGDIVVPAEAYGVGWNGSNEAPTKNDVYDKIQTISSTVNYALNLYNTAQDLYATASGLGANLTTSGNTVLLKNIDNATIATITVPYATNAAQFNGVTTVDATEFGYLNGVTSSIQTQLGSKLAADGYSANKVFTSDGFGLFAESSFSSTEVLLSSGSYSNPGWITGLAWSKISSKPTTISGYGITDANTIVMGSTGNYHEGDYDVDYIGATINGVAYQFVIGFTFNP